MNINRARATITEAAMMPPIALPESWFDDVAEALIEAEVGVVVRAIDWDVDVFEKEIDRLGLLVDEVVDGGVLRDAEREAEDVNVCDVLDDRDVEDDTTEEILAWDDEIVAEGVVVGVEGVVVGAVAAVLLAALALGVGVVEVVVAAESLSTTGDTLESFTGWMSTSRFACRARSRFSTGRRRDPECIGTCTRIIYFTVVGALNDYSLASGKECD